MTVLFGLYFVLPRDMIVALIISIAKYIFNGHRLRQAEKFIVCISCRSVFPKPIFFYAENLKFKVKASSTHFFRNVSAISGKEILITFNKLNGSLSFHFNMN